MTTNRVDTDAILNLFAKADQATTVFYQAMANLTGAVAALQETIGREILPDAGPIRILRGLELGIHNQRVYLRQGAVAAPGIGVFTVPEQTFTVPGWLCPGFARIDSIVLQVFNDALDCSGKHGPEVTYLTGTDCRTSPLKPALPYGGIELGEIIVQSNALPILHSTGGAS